MFQLIGQILLVAWVPGALLLRCPGRARAYRAALPADERWFWSVLLSVVWSTTVAVLLSAAGRYSYEQLLTINGVAAVVVVVALRQHLRWPSRAARPSWPALVPLAIVGLSLSLYLPPAEYVIGGRDPGTYINEGIQIAQRGQMVIRDDVIAGVPVPFRDLFFPSHGLDTHYGLRFMGFFIQNPDDGSVVGQFPHFYPASIAIGYGLNGLSGARQTIVAWAILGLLAVYFTGVRLFGRTAAGAAVVLLALNVVMIWFARYPNSEVPMQTLLFSALLAASHARRGSVFFGAVAGALLGLTLFLRYEILLAIVAFVAAAALVPVSRERLGWSFGAALAATGAAGGWYLVDTMRAYTAYPIGFVSNRGGWWAVVGVAAAAFGAHRLLQNAKLAHLTRRWLPVAIATSIALLAAYAYFLRDEGGRTALGDAMAFRSFGWYVTPGLLLVVVAGATWFVARDFWRDPTFYITFVTFTTFFFYKTRIVPEHFWTSRRFLGMALPGALLLAAGAVRELFRTEHLARLWPGARAGATPLALRIASVVLPLVVLAPAALAFHRQAGPVRHHVEYAGLIPHLEQLASHVADRDLLIVEGRNAGTDLHVLAVPLAYIYAKHVLVLESAAPDRQTLEQFVTWAHGQYERVLFLGGGGTDLLSGGMTADPLWTDRFQVPEYDSPINQYPLSAHAKEFEFGLYRLATGTTMTRGPIDLAIGGPDDLNVVRFHARERGGDQVVYRWTGPQSFVLLMGLEPTARRVIVSMSTGGRPASADPAVVEVALDDEIIGTATPDGTMRPYTFDIPPALAARLGATTAPARLRLRVPTWVPAAAFGGNDTRDLGVIVTRVQVQ